MRRSGLPLLLLSALLLAAPAAEAQAACSVTTALDRSTAQLLPGQAGQFNLTVTDTSAFPGRADVNLSAPSGGWQASITPASAQVASNGNAVFVVAVVAPVNTSLPVLNLAVQTRLTCTDPVAGTALPAAASSSNTLGLSLAPAPSPGPAPGANSDAATLAIVLGAAVLLTLVALALQKRGGIVLTAVEPHRDLPPGGGASFPVQVANRTRRPLRIAVRTSDPPEGWRVLLPPTHLELGPGEERTIQVVVRAPPGAVPPAGAQVDVEAKAEGETLRPGSATLRAFVVDSATAAAAARPDVVVRDERELR